MWEPLTIQWIESMKLHHDSPKTLYSRRSDLKRFLRFLTQRGVEEPLQIGSAILKEFRQYLLSYINQRGQKDKPRTTNTVILAVRLFLKFLYEEGYIPSPLTDQMPYIKEPQSLPQVALTHPQIKKILKCCDTHSLLGYRNRTVLELLYSSGLRRTELVNLKIQDVDTEGGFIRVNQGKGSKDRVSPLGKIASQYVQNYKLGVRGHLLRAKEDPGWLFVSRSGRKLCETNLYEMVRNTAKRAKIEKAVSPHTFRRSCATEMIKNNANLMHVKDILGHQDISSTQIYARLTITDLKKAHQKYHPREKDHE